ncbi:unnamed protein product [Phytophthora fragariaefolia]|uniref:Unnamed protein product n=1 Tax=Phytophthora fragariaefolia TaxID=1490495 RepID=A0A9W6XJA5_9STRA|nr:unnamed protein product [Phytophthora fragariaefolia]
MFKVSPPAISPSNSQFSNASAVIEQFRIRHRQLSRGQQHQKLPSNTGESLEVEDGRARKVPANWREKHERSRSAHGHEDGNWPKPAGTEMHIGFNAFDFSSCPEALYDMEEQSDNLAATPESNQQQYHVETTSGSVWGIEHQCGFIRSSAFELMATQQKTPGHGTNCDGRRRAL